MDEYARVTNRQTMGEIAAEAHGYASRPPGRPRQEPAPEPAPQQPDPCPCPGRTTPRRESSGLAERSAEGMSRASLSMAGRHARNDIPPAGRTAWYSGS